MTIVTRFGVKRFGENEIKCAFLKVVKNILSRARVGLFVAGCLKNRHIDPMGTDPAG